MFVSVYLTCNTGIAGMNLQKLSEIGSYVTNAGPSSLRGIGTCCLPNCWNQAGLPVLREILLPCDLEVSCTSGRLIDYRVCHRSIVNIAKSHSFVEGPWKTHQALLLTLPRSPRRFFTRSLATSPMKFPFLDRFAGSSSWSECVKQSESFHFRRPDRSLPGHFDPDPALSQKLALKYERWSCASENSLLSKCDTETSDRKRFLGRGSETTFRLKLVVQRIPPGEEHFVDQEYRFWSRLISRLKFLAWLVEGNRGIQQRAGIIKYMRKTLCPHLRGMILKTDLVARKRGLCEMFHQLQLGAP